MKTAVITFFLFFTLCFAIYSATGAPASLQASGDEPYAAIVSADEARFVIPVGRKDKWEWNLESTRQNLREYTWQVSVKNGDETYEFGYSLFKKPGSTPQSGDLSALIKAGQQSLWQVAKSGPRRSGGVIYDAGVSVEAEGDNLVIMVKGKENVDRLFSSKPEKVTFQMRTEARRQKTKSVKVTYKD
ncbi:MAG TPA: hypothetical protein VF553_09200 [Pyrinomonadaceae bacterium]